jgi:hypothetical protein
VKIIRAKKRAIEVVPKFKPKRLDLNEDQIFLQRKISEASQSEVFSWEEEIQRTLPEGSLPADFVRDGIRFYAPTKVAQVLGVSHPTVNKYTEGYLRIVRREGENPKDFRERRNKTSRPDSPLTSEIFPSIFHQDSWLISSRVLIFLILAPAQIRTDNPHLRSLRSSLEGRSSLKAGRPLPIHKNSGVTTWEVF